MWVSDGYTPSDLTSCEATKGPILIMMDSGVMNEAADGSFEALLATLRSTTGMERKRAREVLSLVGDPAAPRLRGLLADSRKLVRWEAAKTLVAVVDPGSVEAFVALLSDTHSEVRWLAASGLIALGPRSVAPVLRSLTEPSPTRGRLQMSHRVLKGLSAENDVLASLVEPLLETLKGNDPTPVAPAAARALVELEEITRM